MERNNLCSVLVSSCDSYEDIWFPFFSMFKIMWKDCPYKIYLNTEKKDYQHDGLNITCLHPSSPDVSWSERLKQALCSIESKYVILVLEDFFLFSPVREKAVENVIAWFEKDDSAGFVCFNNEPHYKKTINEEFARIKGDYEINLQLGLWRKEYLIGLLRDESPWGFETYAKFRSHRTKYKNYTHLKGFPKIFDSHYLLSEGYGVYRGRWLSNNPAFFAKHGVEVDFSKREMIELDVETQFEYKSGWQVNAVKKFVKNPLIIVHYIRCTNEIIKTKINRFITAIKGTLWHR